MEGTEKVKEGGGGREGVVGQDVERGEQHGWLEEGERRGAGRERAKSVVFC
jgi:hypothetical protein